jgi:glutamate-5-semialdehyde dehydrogenase
MTDYKTQLIRAKEAARDLRTASTQQKNLFLHTLAGLLMAHQEQILDENKRDVDAATDLPPAMVKRLTLTSQSLAGMAQGLREIADLEDPVGAIEAMSKRPNGMRVGKMRVPIGVIVFVYESRPNVIVDAAGLCLKSGNVLVSRGGKEAIRSNAVLLQYITQALKEAGLPECAVQELQDRNYDTLTAVLQEDQYVDLAVPRGRAELINAVKKAARVPVIAHERGLCHAYIDATANIEQALKVVLNAKLSNPSVCNAVETILIHQDVAEATLPGLLSQLFAQGVEVRGCERTCRYDTRCKPATPEDWDTEYLALIVSIKVVDSYEAAVAHIEKHSSGLTDSIMTEDYSLAQNFVERINSATVLVNASNRLTDGGVFGLGAELGISTSPIHIRGPMGLKEMTVTKYVVFGTGQIRE